MNESQQTIPPKRPRPMPLPSQEQGGEEVEEVVTVVKAEPGSQSISSQVQAAQEAAPLQAGGMQEQEDTSMAMYSTEAEQYDDYGEDYGTDQGYSMDQGYAMQGTGMGAGDQAT